MCHTLKASSVSWLFLWLMCSQSFWKEFQALMTNTVTPFFLCIMKKLRYGFAWSFFFFFFPFIHSFIYLFIKMFYHVWELKGLEKEFIFKFSSV